MADFSLLDARLRVLDPILAQERQASPMGTNAPVARSALGPAQEDPVTEEQSPPGAPPASHAKSGAGAPARGRGGGKGRGRGGRGSRGSKRTSVQQNLNTQAQRRYSERRRQQEAALACRVDALVEQLQQSEAAHKAKDKENLRLLEENKLLSEDVDGLKQGLRQAQVKLDSRTATPVGAPFVCQTSSAPPCLAAALSVNIKLEEPPTPFKAESGMHMFSTGVSHAAATPRALIGVRTCSMGRQEHAHLVSEELMLPQASLDDYLRSLMVEQGPNSSTQGAWKPPYGNREQRYVDELVEELALEDFMDA